MSIIKQLATYDGSAWTTDDIGANASNVSLTTNVAGQSNVQSALSKLCGTSALTASRMVVTNSSGVLTTSTPTADRVLVSAATTGIPTASSITKTELSCLSGVDFNIKEEIDNLNNNLGTANTNIDTLTTNLGYVGAVVRRGGTSTATVGAQTTVYNIHFNPVLEELDYLIIYHGTLTSSISGVYNLNFSTTDFKYDDITDFDNNEIITYTSRFYGASGGGGQVMAYLRATHSGYVDLQYYIPSATSLRWRVDVIRLK